MAIQTEKAIILKTYDFRETSKIATLFTERQGKIKGIFKGIRAGKKNFTTTLDVATLNEIVYYPSRSDLWLVSYADQLCVFPQINVDLETATVAHYILELVDKIMPMHLPSVPIFRLINEALNYLDKYSWQTVIYIYQVKLLELSGFRPSLQECACCGCRIASDAFFTTRLGGLLCLKCSKIVNDSFMLSTEVLASLRYIQMHEFNVSLRLKPSFNARSEMRRILDDFFAYHTNTRIRSLQSMAMI